MATNQSITLTAAERLTHDDACRLCTLAVRSSGKMIVLDLSDSLDASTAAFARLVLLRRELLGNGRDLRLAGLTGRARQLFEVHRLDSVLPRLSEMPRIAPVPRPAARPSQEHRKKKLCGVA